MKQIESNPIKRKRSEDDFVMLRVPKDKQSRQKFLLEHLLRISDSSPSSTGNNWLVDTYTTCIKVPALASGFISTKHLLNQYVKRHSRQLWGFHCFKDFCPTAPVELMNRASNDLNPLLRAETVLVRVM
ncbi:hypothetical protein INT48_000455 [Thamnidium elegans]|uniref:Uncharacterized protein n=1 Tax=Thamnidium elegans TaxID=101142 RepID=A0A8H7SUG8_9FUNG|nr:hypothetical protein INT48_000455 [Thamnidium elegans]